MHFSWKAQENSNTGLIKTLKSYGIIESDEVNAAMMATDRGIYSKHKDEAYNDHPHEIGYGATISAPHMHAKCLELMKHKLHPGAKVLDVGSGSGYLTAVMARMVGETGKVIGIEYVEPLVAQSIENVKKDDPSLLESGRIVLKVGDGWKGDEENGPFDAIHVGAAAATLPEKLVEQLKPGGILIIPVGTFDQTLIEVNKSEDGSTVKQKPIFGVRYVPLVKASK